MAKPSLLLVATMIFYCARSPNHHSVLRIHVTAFTSIAGHTFWNQDGYYRCFSAQPGRRGREQERTGAGPKLYSRNRSKDEFRADRVLANRSGKSRSECFELLRQRRVFVFVEDRWKAVSGPSHKLDMHAPLKVVNDGLNSTLVPMPPPLLIAYHKPKWVLSVRHDPYGRKCLDATTLNVASWGSGDVDEASATMDTAQLHPVGRLDYDSSGLLLFSSDGGLTQRLLHPKHEITKEYTAVVAGRVREELLRAQFTEGVITGEGVHTAKLVSCKVWDPSLVLPYLQQVKVALPQEYNRTDLKLKGYFDVLEAQELTSVTLVVAEGKHRMVRRMLANCGHPVVDLRRVSMGIVKLGDLPENRFRTLSRDELAWVKALLKEK